MSIEIIFEHDAAQVRVPRELNAEKIVRFALVPVCACPDRRERVDHRVVDVKSRSETKRKVARQRVHMIDHFDSIQPVDSTDGTQVVKAKLRIVAQVEGDSEQVLSPYLQIDDVSCANRQLDNSFSQVGPNAA